MRSAQCTHPCRKLTGEVAATRVRQFDTTRTLLSPLPEERAAYAYAPVTLRTANACSRIVRSASPAKAGWLIATEGVHFSATGVRLHKSAGGKITVTDGPFAETKEVIGGYALLKAASKDEVVELTRRFLNVVGQGTCEIHQLYVAEPSSALK